MLLGLLLDSRLGKLLGSELGSELGSVLGSILGNELGYSLGNWLGKLLGNTLGNKLGSALGILEVDGREEELTVEELGFDDGAKEEPNSVGVTDEVDIGTPLTIDPGLVGSTEDVLEPLEGENDGSDVVEASTPVGIIDDDNGACVPEIVDPDVDGSKDGTFVPP